jgi:hypothetical protein
MDEFGSFLQRFRRVDLPVQIFEQPHGGADWMLTR